MFDRNKINFLAIFSFLGIFIATFLICSKVNLYGDDFFYSVFGKYDLSYYIDRNVEHYFLANGRVIVHVLVTAFLSIPMIYWQILNAVFIMLSMVFIVYIGKNNQNSLLGSLICMFMFLSIHIYITRQSIYWLTGSFNYVYPMFMLLLYWFVLSNIQKKAPKFLPILAFLAAATTEQGSMMCFGLTLLYILKLWFIDGKTKKLGISLLASFLGVLSVLLAPGVSNRIDVTDIELGLFELIAQNISEQKISLFFSEYMIKMHILVCIFVTLFLLFKIIDKKTYGKVIYITLFSVSALISASYFAIYYFEVTNLIILDTVMILYVVFLFIIALSEILYSENYILMFALILGFGSQLMMIVSPTYGSRICISFIFMMILFIANLYSNVKINDLPYFVLCAGLLGLSVIAFKGDYLGYSINNVVYEQNMIVLENGEYVQQKLPLIDYAWAMPYDNSYYDPYYNICYDLPQDTTITWTP